MFCLFSYKKVLGSKGVKIQHREIYKNNVKNILLENYISMIRNITMQTFSVCIFFIRKIVTRGSIPKQKVMGQTLK